MQAASEKLHTLLERSIKERVAGLREVTVAFSGGLDSSIIAFLAKKSGVDVHLIHVSLENQPETKHAEKMAEELRLPIHSHTYREKDVQEILQKVLSMIEEPDPVKTSIGVPVYWAAEETAKMKFKVMLAGQGADELFGGYKRYVDDYLQYGKEKVQETIFNDIAGMYETNFERDFKICNYHDVELRLPFSTRQIAEFAAGLPLDLKIKPSKTTLRKLVLRQVAQNLGLPQAIVERPKRAIQYATGISKALRKIARRKGLAVNEYLQRVFNTTLQR
jgi:asparagine synthase (glutamine-hydrolysing)